MKIKYTLLGCSQNTSHAVLHLKSPSGSEIDPVKVTDVSGKLILDQKSKRSAATTNLSSGMYFLEAFSKDKKFTAKFIGECSSFY